MTESQEAPQTSTTEAEPQTVPAVNPTKEEMAQLREVIKQNYNFDVDVKEVVFHFKKSKDKDTGVEFKRESLQLAIPYPSVNGIITILEEGGKGLELLIDAVESVVTAQARDLINEDSKMELNATNFPVDSLSWEFIANMPKAQRRGGGIPKETWEEFAADYLEVMPTATGKTVEQVTNMAKILLNKLSQVKTNEPVLQMVQQQLAVYAENSPNLEDYKDCVEFLSNKAETFLNADPADMLAAL
jgi:hypothetical protein